MSDSNPLIHVITLNWSGLTDTLECLESSTRLDYPNYRVNVVDNGSADGSIAAIRQRYPQVLVSEVVENRGVSGGNNVGLRAARQAGATFVLLVNNDTVLHPNILRAFVEAAARHPRAGVFGAKVYYHAQPDILWTAGATVDEGGRSRNLGLDQPDGPDWDQERDCDYVCGCGLLAHAEVFDDASFFDERCFLMWQEADWCYRVRRTGWGILPDLRRQVACVGRRADPVRCRAARAALRGVADYFLGRYGNGPAWIYLDGAEVDCGPVRYD
jgi:GT2 family glycosyltransferase